METKIPAKSKYDFCKLITVAECQQLIKDLVSDLTREHTLLSKAEEHSQPLDEQTRKLFGLGPKSGLTTLVMAQARVAYLEAAQDRLWEWYRRLTSG